VKWQRHRRTQTWDDRAGRCGRDIEPRAQIGSQPCHAPTGTRVRLPAGKPGLGSRVMSLAVVSVEGVVDALVGGGGLAIDAVGVDLEQDGDAVAGAAGDLGGGHAGVQP